MGLLYQSCGSPQLYIAMVDGLQGLGDISRARNSYSASNTLIETSLQCCACVSVLSQKGQIKEQRFVIKYINANHLRSKEVEYAIGVKKFLWEDSNLIGGKGLFILKLGDDYYVEDGVLQAPLTGITSYPILRKQFLQLAALPDRVSTIIFYGVQAKGGLLSYRNKRVKVNPH